MLIIFACYYRIKIKVKILFISGHCVFLMCIETTWWIILNFSSLKRRRSLKSLRTAKLNRLKKSLNGKHKYIGDR